MNQLKYLGTSAASSSGKRVALVLLEGNRFLDSRGVCMALRSGGTDGQFLVGPFVPCLPAFLSLLGNGRAPVFPAEGCRSTG